MTETARKTCALVVEDDPNIVDLIRSNLAVRGFDTVVSVDGMRALQLLETEDPDIVLLDLMLPEADGFELCRQIRERSPVAIIVVSARGGERDKVTALHMGADDYMTKPFSPRELIARVNAVLRRSGGQDETELVRVDDLTLDRAGHRVMAADRTVTLGPTEYRLLEFFMTHPERVYSREQLLDRVWGGNVYVEERTIDVHIRRLRKALEDFGYDRLVQTVRGAGYRFSARPDA